MIGDFTLDQIAVFLAVVDEGSFSAAGRRLRRVQSGVSAAVANLEQSCGVRLFDRSTRRPTLTPQGRQLLFEARRVMSGAEAFGATARRLRGNGEAEVRLCVDGILPNAVLIAALGQFAQRFPEIALSLRVEELGGVADAIVSGRADWGISGPFSDLVSGLQVRALGYVRLLPSVADGHPLARGPQPVSTLRLKEYPQIVLSDKSDVTRGLNMAVISERVHRVHDSATKRELILAGLGWGNLPEHVLAADTQTNGLVRIRVQAWNDNEHVLPLRVVYPRGYALGPASEWLVEQLRIGCEQLATPNNRAV